jgi:hypothetical protein
MENPVSQAEYRKYKENQDSHVPLGELKKPPHKSFAQIVQAGMPDHFAVSCVKGLMRCGPGGRHFALASS